MKAMVLSSAVAVLLTLPATQAWSLDPSSGQAQFGQPPNELSAQKLLPRAQDELWNKLAKCAVGFEGRKGIITLELTPEVKALDGKTITLHGFVLPMDGSDLTKHFLLSRNTPVCMFCPPGEPNEVVEVRSEHAIAWSSRMVSVTGKFSLINDEENALFFRIESAEAK